MGETDYKDPDWTDEDLKKLDEASLEAQRKTALMKTPEGRQLALEREESERKERTVHR